MGKTLNIESVQTAMREHGLNQARIAKEIGVSRAAVTKWLTLEGFPRPDKLLKLGMLLKLSFKQLVEESGDPMEPVVAFRRKGGRKTTQDHLERAKHMGLLLRQLATSLPFDQLASPATLRNPVCEYRYLQQVAQKIRQEINVPDTKPVQFRDLIDQFAKLHAVIIPVLWGDKRHHENALHVYLPDSMTTWVYLNLDSNIHDFKFWMAHELGHVYAPKLCEDAGEDFADAFAQTLLFPEASARMAHDVLSKVRGKGARINRIKDIAQDYGISPTTVNLALEEYAREHDVESVDVGKDIYAASTNFNKEFRTVSGLLFPQIPPSAKQYISACREDFQSPFFDALQRYVRSASVSAGFVETVLQLPLRDAREIVEELR